MDDLLTATLVKTMQRYLPSGNLAATLMDILSLSRESIYRRLRGEVLFSFEEIIKISHKLGFSLDDIAAENVTRNKMKWAVTDTETVFASDDYIKNLTKSVQYYSTIFQEMSNHKDAVLRNATNELPFRFVLPYRGIAMFSYYKWIYLTQGVKLDFTLSDLVMPEDFLAEVEAGIEKYNSIPETVYILGRSIFYNIVKDIDYFFNRKLISKDERLLLKNELLELISEIEDITTTGKSLNGQGKIDFFLSDVTIDATHLHIEYGLTQYTFHGIYYLDRIVFTNPTVCQKQKDWIELLKRYSTHITQTGEVQRFEFFKKQRELIDNKLSL